MSIPEPLDDPWADTGPSDRLPVSRQRRGEDRDRGERHDRGRDSQDWEGGSSGFERVPPQDLDAEQSVLGGMLLSKDAIADVVEIIKGHDFYRPAHETVYQAILDLYAKGEPADPITVAAELVKRGEITKVGGAPYLHTLVQSVPTAANASYYAEIVHERAVLRRLVEAAHAGGTLVAVDNTLATPLGQRPLELGADFSVASDTKGMTGHGDLLLGHVTCRDADLAAGVRRWRKVVGAIPGPMEAWLAHRSLATLELRIERQCANALALAEALRAHPDVTGLRYPGLPTDASYPTAVEQMRRFGSVVSFVLADRETAERFLSALRLAEDATSFGGVRSTAERRARWGGDAVPEGFIRFSVGAENAADLVADVEQALLDKAS